MAKNIPDSLLVMLVQFFNDPSVERLHEHDEMFSQIKVLVDKKAEAVAARASYGQTKNPHATPEERSKALGNYRRFYGSYQQDKRREL